MLAWIALAGGLLTVPYLIARHRVPVPRRSQCAGLAARIARAELWRLRRGGPLPYAVAIAAGTGFVLIQGYSP
jgi:prepilin peptidase CpaA